MTDAELVERAVRNAGIRSCDRLPKWAHVRDAFGIGSTSATELCRRFSSDPDELTGIDEAEIVAREQTEAEG